MDFLKDRCYNCSQEGVIMFKKSLAFLISLTLIFTIFCGVTVKASTINDYFIEPNRYVIETNEAQFSNLAESFNFAKQKGTGLKIVLNNIAVDFSATYVLNNNIEINSLTVNDVTTTAQAQNNVKAYSISGVKSGLLKENTNGIVEVTLPYTSQTGTPIAVNINSSSEFNVLYTKYNSENQTVTIRTDYFGSFIISDSAFDEFYYAKTILSLSDNSEKYLHMYEKIENGFKNFDEEIEFDTKYTITTDELKMVYTAVTNDHPEYFAFNVDSSGTFKTTPYSFSWDGVSRVYSMFPLYYLTKQEYQNFLNQIETAAASLISDIDINKIGEYEASRIVYERLCDYLTYQKDAPFGHTLYGSLVNKVAVCDGYAKAYQYLLKKLGILSHMVSGYSYNPVTGAGEAHAWNLVRINGEYYYTDVTWADQSNVFYSYLNCDYSQISKDHQFNSLGYNIPQPSATKDNYYNVIDYKIDYNSISSQTLINLIKKQGATIQFVVKNYTGTSLINDFFGILQENEQAILIDVLRYLEYSSMRIGASNIGDEIKIEFYDDSMQTLPTDIVLDGNFIVGNTLSAKVSNATYSDIFDNIIWYRNGKVIDGATGNSYLLTTKDIDSYISVGAFSKNYRGFSLYYSNQTVKNLEILSGSLTLSGSAKVGEVLTANLTADITEGLNYQWYRSGNAITNATEKTYKLTTEDVNKDIYCVVFVNNYLGQIKSNVINNVTAIVMGDVTGDNRVNNSDTIFLRRFLAGWNVTINEQASDMDSSGGINNRDAIYLARHLAGWNGY